MAGTATRGAGPSGRLYLMFTLGGDRYALPASEIVEVLALRPLKRIPEAPPWIAGLLTRGGQAVPVIDLAVRQGGRPAARRASTRLAIVGYEAQPGAPRRQLGLVLEQATETRRLDEAGFGPTGLATGPAGYLGAVGAEPGAAPPRMVQRIEVAGLLPADVRDILFPPDADAG